METVKSMKSTRLVSSENSHSSLYCGLLRACFEAVPGGGVAGGVPDSPDSKDIINVPLVIDDVLEGVHVGNQEEFLEGAKVDLRNCGYWWCTHGASLQLFPSGVAKVEVAVLHHQDEGLADGSDAALDAGVPVFVVNEPFPDDLKGKGSGDVCVHGHCIRGEKFATRWQLQVAEVLFQVKGALEV